MRYSAADKLDKTHTVCLHNPVVDSQWEAGGDKQVSIKDLSCVTIGHGTKETGLDREAKSVKAESGVQRGLSSTSRFR